MAVGCGGHHERVEERFALGAEASDKDRCPCWRISWRVRLDGHEEALSKAWSLCTLKERCIGEVAQDAVIRTERQWQRKFKQLKEVA